MVNTKELIARLRAKLQYKYKPQELEVIVNSIVELILDSASNGEDTSIHGLGKFHARYIKGKKIEKTGIPWLLDKQFDIPSRYHLGFSPSDAANRKVGTLINRIDKNDSNK